MAGTTARGIHYLTLADDHSIADLAAITEAIAESVEAALDVLAAKSAANFIPITSFTSAPEQNVIKGRVLLPASESWMVTATVAMISPSPHAPTLSVHSVGPVSGGVAFDICLPMVNDGLLYGVYWNAKAVD